MQHINECKSNNANTVTNQTYVFGDIFAEHNCDGDCLDLVQPYIDRLMWDKTIEKYGLTAYCMEVHEWATQNPEKDIMDFIHEKLSAYNLDGFEKRFCKWLKTNSGKTISEYHDYVSKNFIFYEGKHYETLAEATKALDLPYDDVQKFINRYFPKNKKEGFLRYIYKHANGPCNVSLHEKRMSGLLEELRYIFKTEVHVKDLLTKKEEKKEKFLEYLNNNYRELVCYCKKYAVNINNVDAYRYDFYLPPTESLPFGALIETDGSQHFVVESEYKDCPSSFSLTDEAFIQQALRDKIKDIFAKYTGIPLLRVSTFASDITDVSEAYKKSVVDFIDAGKTIPYNIYYKPRFETINRIDAKLAPVLAAA